MNKITPLFTFTFILNLSAFAVDHPWHYSKAVLDGGKAYELTQWKLVDKGWRPRVAPGGHWQGDFVPFNEHFEKWVILSTNAVVRPASVPARSVYLDTVNALKTEAKALKDMQKAARKFRKNVEKVRKDFTKYRDKSATEDERAFWQSLLDIIPVPNT